MPNWQTFERAEYQQVKADLHRKILDRLDLENLGRTPSDRAREEVLRLIRNTVNSEAVRLSFAERERLAREILDEIFGLGPLEPLLKDPTVSDILVNRYNKVYVERAGKLEPTGLSFKDDAHLMQIIDRIVSRVGRRVDESSPMVDARLADGSRVNAIIPPLAIDGACLSIRRFGRDPVTARNMLENKTMTEPMLELLSSMVKGRLNLLISGGTGAGKTTLLNVLSGYIPNSERIVTIEDAAELLMKQEHVVRLETRPPNIEGKGAVRQRELVINSLRMRPDRIVVGEVRGEEAFDMLQAMNTGHDGSLTTVHANSQRDALARVESMFSMANLNIPERAVRQQIASAIHGVVQIARLSDGSRKVIAVSEVTGVEGEIICMQDIFIFDRHGLDETGKVRGAFRATGIRPKFADRLATAGCRLRRSERISDLQTLLSQADMGMRAGNVLGLCAVSALALGFAAFLVSSPLSGNESLLFTVVGVMLGAIMPYSFASYRRSKRFQKFEELFPVAIDTLARAVRAGHAFTSALELIANEVGEPVSSEFRKLFEEQKFGLPVRDALLNFTERVPLVDVKFFVTAVMLQRGTGGNLAAILYKLSYLIRDRRT